MIVPFFRSSLINTYKLCGLRCFLEYSVGLRGGVNRAALVGSTAHGVLECLLLEKLAQQKGEREVDHESFGRWKVGERSVENHLDVVYDYYNKESPDIFEGDSYSECGDLVEKSLTFQNGSFDPRNSTPYAAELPFEIVIPDKWASYEYTTPDGQIVKGQLTLKGTVDVTNIEGEDLYHVIDYKTGKTIQDWATGKEKNDLSLRNDPQLMLYYYALAHKFPNADIIMTLYFVRLNKAFTIAFERSKDIPRIHNWLRQQFEEMKAVEKPTYIDGTKDGWKCRFCPHSKNKQPGTNKSVCRYFQSEFANKDMDTVMREHGDYSQLNSYGFGGSLQERT